MSIASWLMTGLFVFVLLGPAVMVAVLAAGVSRRTLGPAEVDSMTSATETADEAAWARVA